MFKVRVTILADMLELWLCYMIGFGVIGCGRPCLAGLVLEVRVRMTG
jgi:hypothetical protein